MSKQQFPEGWDQDRVQRLIDHYESMSDEALAAEDDAAAEAVGQTLMVVPSALVPAVRELIARNAG